MPSNTKDLILNATVQNFAAAPTKVEATLAGPIATIRYMAYGPSSGDFDMAFEFSVDGGATYQEGSPDNLLDLMNISVVPEGEEGVFEWLIEEDLGDDKFNKDVIVRLQLIDSTHVSVWSYLSFILKRQTTDTSLTYGKTNLPKTHEGVSLTAKGFKKDLG